MSLQQVLEIREKEAEIRRTSLPKFPMILIGTAAVLAAIAMAIGYTMSPAGSAQRMNPESMQLLFLIMAIGPVLFYNHFKNARRIAILELEVLKLKRRLAESAEK